MPIGKNAMKRVQNNGYSKVESSAPDMENSSVIANVDAQVTEKLLAPVEKKTRAKKAPAPEQEVAPKQSVKKAKKPAKKESVVRIEVGTDMPYYLL